MRAAKQNRLVGALALFGLMHLLMVQGSPDRSDACVFAPPPSTFPAGPRSAAEALLAQARQFHRRAKVAVNEERDALGAWDPAAAAEMDPESERLQLMAASPNLERARTAARQAALLARTCEEASQAAELLSLIEHEAGHHEAELRWARALVRLQPHSQRAWMVLRRALHCPSVQASVVDRSPTQRAEAVLSTLEDAAPGTPPEQWAPRQPVHMPPRRLGCSLEPFPLAGCRWRGEPCGSTGPLGHGFTPGITGA